MTHNSIIFSHKNIDIPINTVSITEQSLQCLQIHHPFNLINNNNNDGKQHVDEENLNLIENYNSSLIQNYDYQDLPPPLIHIDGISSTNISTAAVAVIITNKNETTHLDILNMQDDSCKPNGNVFSNILIVDDDPLNRKMLCRLLNNQKHLTITTAENGEIAVTHMKESMDKNVIFSLVLMDYQMPVMDGPTATRKIRNIGFKGMDY
jgi:hypothetical protein